MQTFFESIISLNNQSVKVLSSMRNLSLEKSVNNIHNKQKSESKKLLSVHIILWNEGTYPS